MSTYKEIYMIWDRGYDVDDPASDCELVALDALVPYVLEMIDDGRFDSVLEDWQQEHNKQAPTTEADALDLLDMHGYNVERVGVYMGDK